ncbi:hypothetical protein JCM13580A_29800 [Streptomyces drozdowiczii]
MVEAAQQDGRTAEGIMQSAPRPPVRTETGGHAMGTHEGAKIIAFRPAGAPATMKNPWSDAI